MAANVSTCRGFGFLKIGTVSLNCLVDRHEEQQDTGVLRCVWGRWGAPVSCHGTPFGTDRPYKVSRVRYSALLAASFESSNMLIKLKGNKRCALAGHSSYWAQFLLGTFLIGHSSYWAQFLRTRNHLMSNNSEFVG
jgi:hypothetical protein